MKNLMKNKLLMLAVAGLALGIVPANAMTEAENKAFLKKIVLRFHYPCPEVKSYEPLEGTDDELLIMCGRPSDEYGDRDMGYVLYPSGNDNRIRKVKVAPRTYGEWFADWF